MSLLPLRHFGCAARVWLVRFGFFLLVTACADTALTANPATSSTDAVVDTALDRLRHATDSNELLQTASELWQGGSELGQQAILQALAEPLFYSRLDAPRAYEGKAEQLRLAQLVAIIAADIRGEQALSLLNESAVFHAHPARTELLIDAWSTFTPAPEAAISLWNQYSQPDDGFIERTLLRVSENGSATALALLERKLTSAQFSRDHRRYWLRRHAISHRDSMVMLDIFERMLDGSVEPELRVTVLEVLFDFQPKSWYSPHDVPKIPDRSRASIPVLKRLIEVAQSERAKTALTAELAQRIDLAVAEMSARVNLPK